MTSKEKKTFDVLVTDKLVVVRLDKAKASKSAILEWARNNKYSVILVRAENDETFNNYIKELGYNRTVYNASEITGYGTSRTTETDEQYLWDAGSANHVFSTATWQISRIDLDKGGYYVPVKNHIPQYPEHWEQKISTKRHGHIDLQRAGGFGLLHKIMLHVLTKNSEQLIGVRYRDLKKFEESSKWVNAFDALEKKVSEYAKGLKKKENAIMYTLAQDRSLEEQARLLHTRHKEIADPMLRDTIKYAHEAKDTLSYHEDFNILLRVMKKSVTISGVVDSEYLKKMYPMLHIVCKRYSPLSFTTEDSDALINYLNMAYHYNGGK